MIKLRLQKKLTASEGEMLLNIDIAIQTGDFVTLYGKSGAGKTSVLRMISGLLMPDKGRIAVDDKCWLDTEKRYSLAPQQRQIGMVFQEYALFPNMTVRENITFGLNKNDKKSIVDELIDIIALKDLQYRKPVTLSGGQKQRVALARALVGMPQILLLDEPLSAIDIAMRMELQAHILKVHKKYNLTTILVSHDMSEVVRMSDTVFLLEQGVISKQGDPIAVFTNNKMSGKFQFTGEILRIQKEDVVYVVTVVVGANIVRVLADELEVADMAVGDTVIVASKAFNPVIRKVIL